jgi:hypothetical protein
MLHPGLVVLAPRGGPADVARLAEELVLSNLTLTVSVKAVLVVLGVFDLIVLADLW